MDKQNVSNIINSLVGTRNVTMDKLHTAQCEACKRLEPAEAVEVVLSLQRIADKVNRAFGADLAQLDQWLTDW